MMPPWNEICQVLYDLRILILEVEIELVDPAIVHHRRFYLQQFLATCEATWMEIMEKYGEELQASCKSHRLPAWATVLLQGLQCSW